MTDPFADLPKNHFGAILADPPWRFRTWSETNQAKSPSRHYELMTVDQICLLPVEKLAASDCVFFMWMSWPSLFDALQVIQAWGFKYKTCAFSWIKADVSQFDIFQEQCNAHIGLGYWTRSNNESCLLATRGDPKRLCADVRQGIIAPRREHSRKPDGIHERIERLVAGPYLELFARQTRPGWTTWGNEVGKFDPPPPKSEDWHEMWSKPFNKPELL